MAHGQNARGWLLGNKEFYSKRPLSYYPVNKVNKKICHGIERARERELILDELRKLVAFEGGFNI